MKRYLLIACIALILFSCATPGRYPLPLKNQALQQMDSFRKRFLEGRLCDADRALTHAIDIFARIDDMCSISDAYIQKYLFFSYIDKRREDTLNRADEFAAIGNCNSEEKKISDLRKAEEKDMHSADFDRMPNDIYRSVMLRKAAVMTENRKYVEDALKIDRENGWTLFILQDLTILMSATKEEIESVRLLKRIEFLRNYIQDCD